MPGMGSEEFSISANGDYVAAAFRRLDSGNNQCRDVAWTTDVPIYIIPLPQSNTPPSIDVTSPSVIHSLEVISPSDRSGFNSSPTCSYDNILIAYLSMKRSQYESDKNDVIIYDITTRKNSILTASVDVSFTSLTWSLPITSDVNIAANDGYYVIYATGNHHGISRIFRLTFQRREEGNDSTYELMTMEMMTGDESKSSPYLVPYYQMVQGVKQVSLGLYYVETTLLKPHELKFVVLTEKDTSLFQPFQDVKPTKSGLVTLSPSSSHYIRQVVVPAPQFTNGDIRMPTIESHWFEGGGNDMVHLWYVPPLNRDITIPSSVPLVVIVHGGPQGAILNSFNYRWNLCFYAALGTE
jgi:hypothetical protein